VIAVQVKVCNLDVAAAAPSGQETLAKYQKHQPTLVLLDLVTPEMTGSETRQKLLEADKAVCVVMVNSKEPKGPYRIFAKRAPTVVFKLPL
jgi:chemotaxis response regulator CheB